MLTQTKQQESLFAAGNIITDIAHKDGSVKASKRGSLKTALQSAPETALQIINEIRNNPNITLSEMAEKTGVSHRWIATNIKHLQDTGVVKQVGSNKGFILNFSQNNHNFFRPQGYKIFVK